MANRLLSMMSLPHVAVTFNNKNTTRKARPIYGEETEPRIQLKADKKVVSDLHRDFIDSLRSEFNVRVSLWKDKTMVNSS